MRVLVSGYGFVTAVDPPVHAGRVGDALRFRAGPPAESSQAEAELWLGLLLTTVSAQWSLGLGVREAVTGAC
jgi:hypothetical protein